MKPQKNPFVVEKIRDEYARNGKTQEFLKTYKSGYPEIKDLNTPRLWDKLNNRSHIDSRISPMTSDKLYKIASSLGWENSRVLNIGCGGGDLEHIVFKKIHNNRLAWTGVDISSKSVKKCKLEFPNAIFIVSNILKLPFKSQFFDIVILMEILEHIKTSKLFAALREVGRVLKPGGKVIVSIPVNEGLPDMIKRGENPNAHVRAYTKDIIQMELGISGFNIQKIEELYAFSNWYYLKTLAAKYFFRNKAPNNIVIFGSKI